MPAAQKTKQQEPLYGVAIEPGDTICLPDGSYTIVKELMGNLIQHTGGFVDASARIGLVHRPERRRTPMEESAILQACKALMVIAFDPNIRAWLQLNDPKALEQVAAVLNRIAKERLVEQTDNFDSERFTKAKFDEGEFDANCFERLAVHAEMMLKCRQPEKFAPDLVRKTYQDLEEPIPAKIQTLLDTY